jgi:hypothetical protein
MTKAISGRVMLMSRTMSEATLADFIYTDLRRRFKVLQK